MKIKELHIVQYLPERRKMMQWRTDYLDEVASNAH
jgi:hypothetical protein